MSGAGDGDMMDFMRTLQKRTQFLKAARGRKVSGRLFTLQAAQVTEHEPGMGYTVTKRVGNAPERSRIKRRLRAAVAACHSLFKPQHDYVLIGRRNILSVPFETLVRALAEAATHLDARQPATQRT